MAFMKKLIKPKIEELEKAREEFIENAEKKFHSNEKTNILLRINTDALSDIDRLVKKRMGLSRTVWILEAIQEKLEREL